MANSKPFIIGKDTMLTGAQQACVDLLEEALREAKRGKFNTVAVTTVMERGFASAFTGGHVAALYLACADLQERLMHTARGDTGLTAAYRPQDLNA